MFYNEYTANYKELCSLCLYFVSLSQKKNDLLHVPGLRPLFTKGRQCHAAPASIISQQIAE